MRRLKFIACHVIFNPAYTYKLQLKTTQELQKYMPIDIYGKCGPLNCTEGNQGFANLAPAYKFYLAFENSNCFEYITG